MKLNQFSNIKKIIPSYNDTIAFTKVFLISSSLPMFVLTLLYLGIVFKKNNRPSSVPYEMLAIVIPLLYGIFGTINYYVTKKYGMNSSYIIGALFGACLAIIERKYFDLELQLIDLKEYGFGVHLFISMIFYAIIFRIRIFGLMAVID